MVTQIITSGFGGQGVVFLGILLIDSGMRAGYNVVGFPSYGPQMRGGKAAFFSIISDEFIGSPIISKADFLIALSKEAFLHYKNYVKKDGVIIANSSLIEKDLLLKNPCVKLLSIPATEIANQIFSPLLTNMVCLGALCKLLPFPLLDKIFLSLQENLKRKEYLDVNKRAIEVGYNYF